MKRLIGIITLLVLLSACGSKAEEYKQSMESVLEDIENSQEAVDDVVSDYASIWSFSIENSSAIPVDAMAEYTGLSHDEVVNIFGVNAAGNVSNDFSDNIHSLINRFEEIGIMDDIKNDIEKIKEQVSDLKEPPKRYEKAYDELLELYDLSSLYTEMAINPSGSLQDFNSKRDQIYDDINSQKKRIEVIMPND